MNIRTLNQSTVQAIMAGFLVFAGAVQPVAAASKAGSMKGSRPNVLVIYTDDQRYSGVHALGGQGVQTPEIDKLANDGVVFTRTYLMGALTAATCIPSRAMLLTGRNVFELDGVGHNIPKTHTTIGQAFHNAGYQTYMVGKWHQDKASLARSFDSGATIMSLGPYLQDHYRMPLWDWDPTGKFKASAAYLIAYDENGKPYRRPLSPTDKRGPIGNDKTGPLDSQIFADSAIAYIKQEDRSKPFFMYLAFHCPHDPRQSPEKYHAMYPPNQTSLPPSYLPEHPFDNGAMTIRDEELAPWPRTPAVVQQQLSDYYAAISFLDTQVGRVIQALKDNGTYDQTLIVFSSDSGLAVGCHGLMGKQNVYDEDGLHVPFIISGKVNGKGRRVDALSYIHDIFPTLCDLAGIEKPESATGKSLAPVLRGEKQQVRHATYHAYRQHQRAYRKGDYKLIEYVRAPDRDGKNKVEFMAGSRVTQLFNVKTDPWETTDLSFQPAQRQRVALMRKEMREQAEALGDTKEVVKQKYDFWDYYENK